MWLGEINQIQKSRLRDEAQVGVEALIEGGRPVILPSTFQGSPCVFQVTQVKHLSSSLQHATCNPEWKEIKDKLLPGQTATDMPHIVSRVFKCF